jgi:penicillin G amidase
MQRRKLIVSVIVLAILLGAEAVPLGPLPPLSGLLNPQTGIWAPSNNAAIDTSAQTFTVSHNGSVSAITVALDTNGFVRIASNTTWGVYFEQGYQAAKYRLTQLDFTRRLAEGNLSAILGSSELASDEYYRTLEMYPVAQEIVSNLSKTSLSYVAVSEYTAGINAYISTLTPATLPLLFKLLQYSPTPWSMADSFIVQQLVAWQLSGSSDSLYFNYALEKMPETVIAALYPAYPGSIQHPIEPESLNSTIYSESGNLANLSLYTPTIPSSALTSQDPPAVPSALKVVVPNSPQLTQQLNSILSQLADLRFTLPSLVDEGSNDWAVSANLTKGGALLANDPHLSITVPSIWLGFQLVSPGQNVVGVMFPGAPGVILGHNAFIAWGATDGEDQVSYYYEETLNPSNPNEYMHDGSWTSFSILNETIGVKGAGPTKFDVKRATNGVVIQGWNGTIAMDWTGLYPENDLGAVLDLDYAGNVTAAQAALETFKVGIENWAVADSKGNIGIFTYGLFPIVKAGNPRGILPGTGEYDWVGFIPISDQPHLVDPSNGFVFSANEIQVSQSYPYYIGWDFESGYRANQIYTMLSSASQPTLLTMKQIQLSVHDSSTNIFLPALLQALAGSNYSTSPEYRTLQSWNGDMDANSSAATIYYAWLNSYINDTFNPYMQFYNITESEGLYSTDFFLGPNAINTGPLVEDLANWTANYPTIQWFNNPETRQTRNSTVVMRGAFSNALGELGSQLGTYSQSAWAWGNLHKRLDPSLFGVSALAGPTLSASGDDNTPNAAYSLNSTSGPSWRQVTDMSAPLSNSFGIYPGGLTENPTSPYYSNTVNDWNNGVYYTLIPSGLPSVFYYLYQQGGGVEP